MSISILLPRVETSLYVALEFEDLSYLFVVDRIKALPGENEEPVSRGIIASVALPFDSVAQQILVKDNLLITGSNSQVAVLDISSPTRPFVLKTWDSVEFEGKEYDLSIDDLTIKQDKLWLTTFLGRKRGAASFIYDLSTPELAITAVNSLSAPIAGTPLSAYMVNSEEQISFWDLTKLDRAKRESLFNGFGFTLPGNVTSITTSETLATQALEEVVGDPKMRPAEYRTHLPVYDLSDKALIRLHDVVTLCDLGCVPGPLLQTDDGISILSIASDSYYNKLSFVDLHTLDINSS